MPKARSFLTGANLSNTNLTVAKALQRLNSSKISTILNPVESIQLIKAIQNSQRGWAPCDTPAASYTMDFYREKAKTAAVFSCGNVFLADGEYCCDSTGTVSSFWLSGGFYVMLSQATCFAGLFTVVGPAGEVAVVHEEEGVVEKGKDDR